MTAPVEVYQFVATIPAATPIAAPVTTPMVIPARIVTSIEVDVPAGHNGNTGFQITTGGQLIIPPSAVGGFIVGSGRMFTWALGNFIETGAWAFTAYNLGNFSHKFYITILASLLPDIATVVAPVVSGAALSS